MQKDLIAIFLTSGFCFIFFSVKTLAIFQQCSYRVKEFLPALFKRKNQEIKRLLTYSLIFAVILAGFSFAFDGDTAVCFSFGAITLSAVCYFKSDMIKPAAVTKRFFRICLIAGVACGAYSCLIAFCFYQRGRIGQITASAFCGILPLLSPFFICVSGLVNLPYDKLRLEVSKAVCKKRLSKNKNQIRIGITGSFGKTSVKNYLYKMLCLKYKVLATPKSYNTPLGICKTVKKGIEKYDVFIAEMGARYKNDIKKLCKMVKPSVGIVTGITHQHTQTLGDVEKVKRAKNQLIDGLSPSGFAVFSMQTQYSAQMYDEARVEKLSVGTDKNNCVCYQNIKQTVNGIFFEIVVCGKAYKTFAPLLGEHNALNICLATAAALRLGVEIEKILSVIPALEGVEHRAQLINAPNGITVIDDGYNANLDGIRSTAKAISCFTGYKIAVTPGIVELGSLSYEINCEVGKILSEVFDLIIGVGSNSRAIEEGASCKNAEFIHVEKTLDAKGIISQRAKKGDVVAFFNDIPDRY